MATQHPPPRLFLHNHPVSSYAIKVRIALRAKNVPFDFATPGTLGAGAGTPQDFLAANPRAEVPALVDGDVKVFDSKVILEYLEDKFPEVPLLPRDPVGRAKARMVQEVCDTQFEAINWGMSEVRVMGRAEGELAEAMVGRARAQTAELLGWLEGHLGEEEFFNGGSFGFGDLCVWPYVSRSYAQGFGPGEGSPLQRWLERVEGVPSVRETREEVREAMKTFAAGIRDAFKPGTGRRREYRDHRLEWMVKSGGIGVVAKGLEEDTIRFSWPSGKSRL